MSAIFILIGISLMVALGFLISFLWSIKAGQFDDSYTPAIRILFDDAPPPAAEPEPEQDKEKGDQA